MNEARSAPTSSAPAIIRIIGATSGLLGKYGGRFMLVLVILIMVYEVVARYVFGRPTMWALEYSIYSQVLLVALSAAYVLREEGHVAVGLVLERCSERRRNWLICTSSIAGACYCAVLTIQMWNTASWSFRVNTASETMGVPLAPLQFVLTAGMCLLGLQFLARSYAYGKKALEATATNRQTGAPADG